MTWAGVMLVVGTLAGYAAAGTSIQAQAESWPFSVGETVTLWYAQHAAPANVGSSVRCTVAEIRSSYVRCGPVSRISGRADRVERWFSLKYVASIEKLDD